jgi:hypothetical protein
MCSSTHTQSHTQNTYGNHKHRVPKELWGEFNLVWVGLGQEIQQEKGKLIRKCLICSAPTLALKLLKKFGACRLRLFTCTLHLALTSSHSTAFAVLFHSVLATRVAA